MDIQIINNATGTLNLKLTGRLDTITAPEFEAVIEKELPGNNNLELDFTDLQYVSSAGLRVLLGAKKILGAQGTVIVKNVNDYIQETFEITGFSDLIEIR